MYFNMPKITSRGISMRNVNLLAMATALLLGLGACASPATRHPLLVADLGAPASTSLMEASLSRPGVIRIERVRFAQWTGGRGAFIDRDDPSCRRGVIRVEVGMVLLHEVSVRLLDVFRGGAALDFQRSVVIREGRRGSGRQREKQGQAEREEPCP